jgi:nanoRNase/pAp phosphatase (c-di-AMP/oligoRNAs hydrolase)
LHSSAHSPSKADPLYLPNFIAALAIDHFLAAILEHGALHERLRAHARVHARRLLVVVVVEDVCGAEAQQRAAAGDFVEVVVGVGDAEVAGVFGGVAVRVADEGAFGLGRGG